jgi:hypothetical protein
MADGSVRRSWTRAEASDPIGRGAGSHVPPSATKRATVARPSIADARTRTDENRSPPACVVPGDVDVAYAIGSGSLLTDVLSGIGLASVVGQRMLGRSARRVVLPERT